MSANGVLTIHTDGASRGNPGPAAFAYTIEREGGEVIEEKGCLGSTTNNIAEWTALVHALEHAQKLGGRRLVVLSDSELMVKQMNGEYKVKHEGIRPLYEQASALRRQFDSVQLRHVRREENSRADRLCNEALDGGRAAGPKPAKAKAPPTAAGKSRQEAVREEAVQCLRAVAAQWSRGDPNNPRPEQVWEQLWTILEDGGVLRPAK
jgi:ribonuclease HI